MSNNYDLAAFKDGFKTSIQLSKEAGWGDTLWNHTAGAFGQYGAGRKAISNGLQWAGGELGKGAVNGGTSQVKQNIGLDPNKGFMDGGMEAAQKAFGWDTTKGWGDNIAANPVKSGLIGAGVAAGGYGLGKMLGWWGGDNNNPSNHQPQENAPPSPSRNFSAAYTPGLPSSPQALQKASSFNLPPNIKLPEPEFKLPSVFGPAAGAFQGMYSMMQEGDEIPAPQPRQDGIRFSPGNSSAEKALANPKMRAYLSNVIRDSYSR